MDQKLLDAYYEYSDARARQGVPDHSMINDVLDGKTVEEHIVDVLRAADMLPDEYRDEAAPRRSA